MNDTITQAIDPLAVYLFGVDGPDEYTIDHARFWATAQGLTWRHSKVSLYRVLSVRYHRDGRIRNSYEEMAQIMGVHRGTAANYKAEAERLMRRVWQQYAGIKDGGSDDSGPDAGVIVMDAKELGF